MKVALCRCASCGKEIEDLIESSAKFCDKTGTCDCGGDMQYAPALTEIRTENSATFLDGTDRGFKNLKEAHKLEMASYNLPYNKRKEYKQEIAKLKRSK